jgi:hypothetical protein
MSWSNGLGLARQFTVETDCTDQTGSLWRCHDLSSRTRGDTENGESGDPFARAK